MKHYGPEPPWRGEGHLGYWIWIPPDLRDWFEGPGYWQWYPPRTTLARLSEVLLKAYRPRFVELLNKELKLEIIKGKPLPKSEVAKAAE